MMRLKELREERRLSQDGLALKLNVSQSTISAYEVGDRTPDLETLIAIAQFFGVSLDYLAGQSDLKQQIRQSDLNSSELEHLRIYRQLSDMLKACKADCKKDRPKGASWKVPIIKRNKARKPQTAILALSYRLRGWTILR